MSKAVSMMPNLAELPPGAADKAARAAVLGTRHLIATESFDALVALLCATGAVPVQNARAMMLSLADTLSGHARAGRHDDFAVAPAELLIEAMRLRMSAEAMS